MGKKLLLILVVMGSAFSFGQHLRAADTGEAPPIHDEALPSAAPLMAIEPGKRDDEPVIDCNPEGYVGRKLLRPGENRTDAEQVDTHEIRQPLRILFSDSLTSRDFRRNRLNLMIDKDTYQVIDARCG